jgi:hypothetical protein
MILPTSTVECVISVVGLPSFSCVCCFPSTSTCLCVTVDVPVCVTTERRWLACPRASWRSMVSRLSAGRCVLLLPTAPVSYDGRGAVTVVIAPPLCCVTQQGGIDIESLKTRGTSTAVEKRYLRLTAVCYPAYPVTVPQLSLSCAVKIILRPFHRCCAACLCIISLMV